MAAPELTDVVLRDGLTVALRQAGDADVAQLPRFFETLSPESRHYRFHGGATPTESWCRSLVGGGGGGSYAVIAESGDRIVGFASLSPDPQAPNRAEVAFAVADALQGHGLGTRLLERLAAAARQRGIDTFDAYVLGDNLRMLDVFRDSGFSETVRVERGVCHVTLSTAATGRFVEQAASRSQQAATASMRPFFQPETVAVIGANRGRGKIGSEILHNLIAAGFRGTLIPIHPSADSIAGLPAYRRVSEIPRPVDLAIVVVPAAEVLPVVDDCIGKRIPAICVISAGFSECDGEGKAREAALVDKVRRAGCRLIGPNCMGLLNTDPAVRLNATFSPVYPPRGPVAMSTQSGALGLAILDYAERLDIGISSFVSVGNKADVSGNDLIQYWGEDANTSVILLYLESFGNPRKFSEIARRVGRVKPIVAVKAGRSVSGTRAAASHTGALAANDVVVDALFRQAGVIRTDRLEEMFDVAALLSHQPLPRGPRVAILTNAGGPGILAADACEAHGLQLPALGDAARRDLRSFLPAAASVNNPIDMLASAPAEHYRRALETILRDEGIDSVIVIFIPPLVTDAAAVASVVAAAARDVPDKPVLGVFMRSAGAPPALSPIPSYPFPESAALALARATTYARWRSTEIRPGPELADVDRAGVRRTIDTVLARGGGWATADETAALLRAAAIPMLASRTAGSLDEAVRAADEIGYPVALKALGPTLLHKSERRAVALHLADVTSLRAAYDDFATRFAGEMTAVLVQQMAPAGVEMIVGAIQDPLFGPVIACGSGGTLVEVLADTCFRLHPLSASDPQEMIDGLRGVRLLRGYRGTPPADERGLRDVLFRVSELLTIAPEISELDLNPVAVMPAGVCVVDARLRVAAAAVGARGRRVEY